LVVQFGLTVQTFPPVGPAVIARDWPDPVPEVIWIVLTV
jgi:hypothetical protein